MQNLLDEECKYIQTIIVRTVNNQSIIRYFEIDCLLLLECWDKFLRYILVLYKLDVCLCFKKSFLWLFDFCEGLNIVLNFFEMK